MIRWLLIALLAAAVAIGGGIAAFNAMMTRPLVIEGERQLFELPIGASVTQVSRRLVAQGISQTPGIVFRVYARLTADRGFPQAGEYELTPSMTTADALALFRSGRVLQRTITFPEGWTFDEWRAALAAEALIDDTISSLPDEAVMVQLGAEPIAAEGQFFPDTYHFVRGESDLSILARAHARMKSVLDAEWRKRSSTRAIETPYEALILASIVEKETGVESDRDPIAGVFINRLVAGMRLQSDPTVIYGIEDFDGDLKRFHLREATDYNTYVIRGLPPTPICNPGLESIRSVMNAPAVPYYYFVARGDGSSQFSVTLDEHNEAVARYQKAGSVK